MLSMKRRKCCAICVINYRHYVVQCKNHKKKGINRLSQETLTIAGYFTKMKRIWSEFNFFHSNVSALKCVHVKEKRSYRNHIMDNERFGQFLMSLKDNFSQIRRNILMINCLLDINHASF